MLNKLNTFFRLVVVGLLIYPFPIATAYHVETQAPYGTNASNDPNAGTFTIGILGSDGAEDLPPDSYTIFFSLSSGITETNSFCVTTSFGHQTNTWQYHTFSLDDLKYYFEDPAGQTIYYRVRANNEANYNFSDLTNQQSWNLYAGPPFEFNQTDWSAPTGTDACDDPKVLNGVGIPQSLSTTKESDGTISLSWSANSGTYELSPTSYDIKYGYNDVFAESWVKNVTSTSDSLSRSWLETQMNLSESRGITYKFQIRAKNGDTVSDYTSLSNVEIGQTPSGVGENYTLTETTDGITVDWDAPTSNWVDISGYRILVAETYDQDYNANTWFEVYRSTDTTTTAFTLPWVDNNDNIEYTTLNGTYYYRISTCSSSWWCNDVESNITIDNTLGPPMNPTVENVYDSGVLVKWDAANTGSRTATTYELYYRTDVENETVVYNITNTSYTIPYGNIDNGSWTFSIRGYNSVYNVYSGYSTEPSLEVFNQKAKDDADAAATPPPPPPTTTTTTLVEVVNDDGTVSTYTEDQISQGDAERDKQRRTNDSIWGCYMTDAQLERGDCTAYNESLVEETKVEETKDDTIIVDEKDDKQTDNTEGELPDDGNVVLDVDNKDETEGDTTQTDVGKKEDTTDDTKDETNDTIIIELPEENENEIKAPEIDSDADSEQDQKAPEIDSDADSDIEKEAEFDSNVDSEKEEPILTEEEVDEVLEEVLPDTITKEKYKEIATKEVEELTEEEVEVVVAVTEKAIEKVVELPVEEIIVIEEEELKELSDEEVEEYVEQVEEQVAEVVKELPTEKKVQVVKEVAKVSVQNLATADTTTKAVVKAVVKEVTKTETVAELDEEEKKEVGKVLGFQDETAADDVEIIAKQAEKEEAIATAVEEYVDRAIESKDVENFTLADVVVEIQVEQFTSDPIGALVDVQLEDIDFSEIGNDMTNDQKEKAQEVVVPVIIASQIISQAGALMTRRF